MKPKTPRSIVAEWRARLADSGFQDLEGADRDGPLSDRGNLHPVSDTPDGDEALARRIETGSDYHDWATGVLHGHRFRSGLERRIWERHTNGEGMQAAARALGITYHQARDAVLAVKQRVGSQGSQGRKGQKWRSSELSRRYRRLTPEIAVKLAAVLLKTQMRS